jgi:hypothetical protein
VNIDEHLQEWPCDTTQIKLRDNQQTTALERLCPLPGSHFAASGSRFKPPGAQTMTAITRSPKCLTIQAAAYAIGTAETPLAYQTLLRAARKLGILQYDDRGFGVIAVSAVQRLRENYRTMGYLHRRGARSLEPAAEASS